MSSRGPYLELVLARNLIAALVTPAFVVDADGVMTFFNESAGRLIGRRFDESGRLSRDDWNEIGPVDEQGQPAASEKLPLTVALRDGRPAIGAFRIKTDEGSLLEVEASAIPLCSSDGFCGALVTFVPAASAERQAAHAAADQLLLANVPAVPAGGSAALSPVAPAGPAATEHGDP